MATHSVSIYPVSVKRIYADPSPDDGARILVDRLWPRGVSKERAALTEWLKDVAPTPELRTWYAHDPAKFGEFASRYENELSANEDQAAAYRSLLALARRGAVTLLTATKDPTISEAEVLRRLLTG